MAERKLTVRRWAKGSSRGAGEQSQVGTVYVGQLGPVVVCPDCGGSKHDGPRAHSPRHDARQPGRLVDCVGRWVCRDCFCVRDEQHTCGFYEQQVGVGS